MTVIVDNIKRCIAERPSYFDTPCYVFDLTTLTQRIDALKAALGTPVVLSLKANPNVDLNLRIIHSQPQVEVASLRELNIVAKATKGPVYLNNPSMDRNLIRAGIGAKAHFVVDSPEQLRTIMELAGARHINPILLRLNSSVLNDFVDKPLIPLIMRADHFGVDWKTALTVVDTIRASNGLVKLAGFHLFAGPHTFVKNALATAEVAPRIVAALEERYGAPLTRINLGGGFSERWDEEEIDFEGYRERLKKLPSHIAVLHESGRGLFASCGVFLTRVITTKSICERHYAVCDGGMNQNFLLCQTENHFRRPREAVVIRDHEHGGNTQVTTLVGSTCSRDDVIGQATGAALTVGDICAFANCGAYHSTYTVSSFLGLKSAQHYVIP